MLSYSKSTGNAMGSLVYLYLHATFCVLVILSNLISGKLISLPFGFSGGLPAGVIVYPLTFLISDLVTELYGVQKAKQMVYGALGLSLLSFCIVQLTLWLPSSHQNNQHAFYLVMHSSGLAIMASLIAYLFSQLIDIQIYSKIRHWTGPNILWLRTNVSTLFSQLIDTVIVSSIHLYWGLGMEWQAVCHAMLFAYGYKAFFSVMNTPFFYACTYYLRSKIQPENSQWLTH
jgi:queuosine precursor transporter